MGASLEAVKDGCIPPPGPERGDVRGKAPVGQFSGHAVPVHPVGELTGRLCRQKHRHRNTDSKIGPGWVGTPAGNLRKTLENPGKPQKLKDPAPT